MAMHKIKKGDHVIVIAGRDNGKRGDVLKVLANGRLLVDGINLVKKSQKPNPNLNIQGGIIEQEASIHQSNVALFNPSTEKADRVGVKLSDDGKKRRYFKSNDEWVDA